MTDALPPLRDVIAKYDLRAKKSFGQNFLLDLNLTGRIARVPGDISDATIYEVGPGPGGLTRALLTQDAKKVVAVEMDPRCMEPLKDVSAAFDNRLTVYNCDALDVDETAILSLKDTHKAHIVSNLPYNVGTQLLIKWLTYDTWLPWFSSLTLMFQKEVAERLVAKPNTKAYGRLSVLTQWRGKVRIAFTVPPQAFTPQPKVTSAVIHYKPTEPMDPSVRLADLEKIVAKAFNQRRKMLRASLKGLDVDPKSLLEAANLEETKRAEDITVEEFVRLAKVYRELKS